jgi:hypothetical protein
MSLAATQTENPSIRSDVPQPQIVADRNPWPCCCGELVRAIVADAILWPARRPSQPLLRVSACSARVPTLCQSSYPAQVCVKPRTQPCWDQRPPFAWAGGAQAGVAVACSGPSPVEASEPVSVSNGHRTGTRSNIPNPKPSEPHVLSALQDQPVVWCSNHHTDLALRLRIS